jgi:hypothetical protein
MELQSLIKEVLRSSRSLEEFTEGLQAHGVNVRVRKASNGRIEGISYKLDDVAFQGRKLGKDYSWHSIEATLENNAATIAPTVEHPPVEAISEAKISQKEVRQATSQPTELPITVTEKTPEINIKERYRMRYLKLVENVLSQASFKSRKRSDIDTGIALLVLKDSDLNDAKAVLTQSDAVKAWKETLPPAQYRKIAEDYILRTTNRAMVLYQSRNRNFVL